MIGGPALVIYVAFLIYEPFVVKNIPFHAIDDLYVDPLLFFQVVCSLGRIRKCLDNSVVGYGNCRLTPISSLFYYIFRLVEAVHGTHLCMCMKFDPFSVRPCILAVRSLFPLFYVFYHYYIEVFKCIPLYLSPKSYGVTGMQMFFYLAPLCLGNKGFGAYGGGIVCEQHSHEKVLALYHSEIYLEDHTFHNGCPLGRIYIPEGGDCLRCAYLTAHYAVALGRQFFIPEAPFLSAVFLPR